MNKLRYIFLSILTCTSSIDAKLDNPQRPISANLYKTLTPINLVHGQKITKPGAYLLSSSTTIPDTIYSSQNTTTIGGDATSYNTGVISIETNNVTLDLNGLSLKTNKFSLVAIQIADGVSNIVIENGTIAPGTATWSNAILIGYDTKNITLKNLTFIGCSNSNGSVHIFGDATHFVDNVLLENIQVLNQTGSTTSLDCSYVNSLHLINIKSNNASVSGTIKPIKLLNCKSIIANTIQINNNSATEGFIGLNLVDCNNISLKNISAVNNTSSTAYTFGISLETCNNIEMSNVKSNRNSGTTYCSGINIDNCMNLKMKDISSSNNNSTANMISILITETNNIEATNIIASTNTGTNETIGLSLYICHDVSIDMLKTSNCTDTTTVSTTGMVIDLCANIRIDGFESNNLTNTKSGIMLTESSHVSIYNASMSNCTSDGALKIIAGGVNLKNIKFVNCSITNNTAMQFTGANLPGIQNLYFENLNMNFNTSSSGNLHGIYSLAGQNIHILNSSVSHNRSDDSSTNHTIMGIVIGIATNIFIDSCTVSNNQDTCIAPDTNTEQNAVYGIFINSVTGCTILNTQANHNTGAEQINGFRILYTDNTNVVNCTANGNVALSTQGTGGTDTDGDPYYPSPTAGFLLYDSNYCTFELCTAKGNKSGNYAPGGSGATDIVNIMSSYSGFGFINSGQSTSNLNIGNSFIHCVSTGNGTGLDTTISSTDGGSYPDLGTGTLRYWLSEACAGGFGDQWSQATEYYGCTANNNGLQDNVLSYGFLISESKQVNIKHCTASHNWFYGFVDDGAQRDTLVNNETTLFANYACMNGEQNSHVKSILYNPPGAIGAGVTDGHLRNYWLYFSEEGQDIPIKKVAYGGQDMAQIPGNIFFNISMAYDS